jgi:hydroxyacylglutathione hydrolase
VLVEQSFTSGLGHASYLVADPDSGVAFLVDPERDPEPYLVAAARLGVLITHAFETHVHNDYLSGSAALARIRPITVVTGAGFEVEHPHVGLADGEEVAVGQLVVRCLATPGHTPEHVSYLVADLARSSEPQYLFSGGALLVGHIARVDLFGPQLEERLARDAYDTLRDRIMRLEDHLAVFPTHGGGSACSTGTASSRWTTLGFERRYNAVVAAAARGFDTFHAEVTHALPAAPAYYPHVRALNARGASLPPRGPLAFIGEDGLARAGVVLIDPRPPHVFGAGHRRGALNDVGNDAFAVRLGGTVPFGSGIVLLTDDPAQAERLRDQIALIGYDDVRGYAPPRPPEEGSVERIEQLDPRDAAGHLDGRVVLDVREPAEWEQGHLPGAVHIPYGRLRERMSELPKGRAILAYCATGIRSSLATSLLHAAGYETSNLRGGFTAWRNAGLPVARPEEAPAAR